MQNNTKLWKNLIILFILNIFLICMVQWSASAATVKQGSTGSTVTQVQQKLKSLGYYTGSVDGIFGSKTTAAVKAFQKAKGLTADGVSGPKTLAALGIGATSSSSLVTLKKGANGETVKQVQQKLKALGYYTASVDGIYGSKTTAAIKAFQKAKGLKVDGVAGPQTMSALGISGNSANVGVMQSDINLIARIISAEARGESYTGQVAVGAVIMNRVKHPSFPNTISGVVYQKGAFAALNDHNINKPVVESATRAAQDAIKGTDPTGGAIYYYNPNTSRDAWIRTRPIVATIGNHVFAK